MADVVTRMREIDTEVPARDGVGVFNRVYLRVTELVLTRIAEGGFFHDDEFMTGLDIAFADLWFTAYDASSGRRVPKAWAPLFAARDERGVLPIQFALAGMNAHIEHDLALAVVRTCQAHGRSPASPGVHHDYELVNDLLAGVEAEIRRTFLTEVGQAVDEHLRPVAHLVSAWNIDKARDVAWVNALALWELRRIDFLFDRYAGALARSVGMGSRLLLADVLSDR